MQSIEGVAGNEIMKIPFISIVVTTYNRLLSLAELVESLSRQTYQDFEIIIVNDYGESVTIIKKLYPFLTIRIIDLPRNLKHVHARNVGVEEAKGEWILLMDDDDLLVPTHIERMVNEINDADLLYSDVEIVHFQLQDRVRIPVNRQLFAYEMDLMAMRRFSTFVPSGSLYKRSLHDHVGWFDPEVHNYWDWDFFLRVSECNRVKRVPSAGVLYDFSNTNQNQSKELEKRAYYLNKLSEKHNLGVLPSKNFFLLLEEPEIQKRKAVSNILWDGKPFQSKLIAYNL